MGEESELLRVEKVTRVIGSGTEAFVPLHPTSLTLEAGQVVMITGPSGSGKTTLLSILGCILSPTSGRVFVATKETTHLSGAQRAAVRAQSFGFIFQQYHLFDSLSALGNVTLAAAMKGFTGGEARDESLSLLELVGLGAKARTLPGKLSGGEKQRVAIARALVGRPRVLLCDEPTAALDTTNALTTIRLLRNLAKDQGRLVVIVTHDHRLEAFADRVLAMEDGRVVGETSDPAGGETGKSGKAPGKFLPQSGD